MEELRVDMRKRTPEEQAVYDRQAQLNAVDVIVVEKILRRNGLYEGRRTLRKE